MNRRRVLSGLIAAPAVILTPGLLMPIKPWIAPVMFPGLPPGGFGPFEFRSIAGKMFELIDGEWVEI